MTDLHFANSNWGYALWLVLVLIILLLWLDHRGGAALNRFLSPVMQGRLARRTPRSRRWFSILCLGLASVCLIVALMRPQWGLVYQRTPRVGAQIMVCLDVSKSMLAEDAAPNRLERAKAEVSDLLSYLQGDQVGLIAFSGKAAVLCPLTPDFGFFRMILNDAGPHSVGMGGTILSTPLRKAIEGFRGAGEVSRVILLITDGEDHAQHEDDLKAAANEAAERGIKVIAIGFGDERGSSIQITDPRTGVRTTLRDADGKEVVSRLDGDTLRELALKTEGAYLPAGTGVLDLESIYDTHIYPLVRGELEDRGRAVRRDIFQWAIMMGLLLLVVSVAVGNAPAPDPSFSLPLKGQAAVVATVMFLLSLGIAVPSRVYAQAGAGDGQEHETLPATENGNAGDSETEPPVEIPMDPREAYNDALPMMDTNLDQAEELLATARRGAGTDGELRFRATYNRGCLEARRADQTLEEEPQQALKHLRSAADWFRDAVRLRPDNLDARHNLEVVLRRALQLADALAPQEEQSLAQNLDHLITAQRELLKGQRVIVERASSKADPHVADSLQSEFRQLAVSQRELLSDAEALAGRARNQRQAIMAKKHEERTPEEQIRAVQLESVQRYIFQAAQRMGQSRSQLRRKQSLRAYRRGTNALEQLKRARDQLRDPVELLSSILTDATRLAGETRHFAVAEEGLVVKSQSALERPAWLDVEYLEQSQKPTTERTAELSARLEAGLADVPQPIIGPQPPTATDIDEDAPDPETLQFLGQVREAAPFVKSAEEDFVSSEQALEDKNFRNAYEKQVTALQALSEARERFLDLRGLIELAYAGEKRIQSIVSTTEGQATDKPWGLFLLAGQLQIKNINRGRRLGTLIADQLTKLPDQMGPPTIQQSQTVQPQDAQRQQFQIAEHLLDLAVSEMHRASELLRSQVDPQQGGQVPSPAEFDTNGEEPNGPDAVAPEDGQDAVDRAVEHLQALRRLFYSIVEHLRETAERQAELNDETESARTINQEQPARERLGPFVPRQQELGNISGEIAKALQAQAQQVPQPAGDPQRNISPQQQPHQAEAATRQFEQAAELVEQAEGKMLTIVEEMDVEEPGFEKIRKDQDEALRNLEEALALLNPAQQQQQQSENEQQQQSENEQQQEQQQNQRQDVDPRRLLQSVRDREAQRRREKAKQQQTTGYRTVDKDW